MVPRPPHRPARWRTTPLLLALLLLPASATASETPDVVPAGAPVSLDGTVQPAEWADALYLPIGPGPAGLRLRQRRGTLMIALDGRSPWPQRGNVTLYFCPEGEKAGGAAPGAVSIQFEPREHDRPHVIVKRQGARGDEPIQERVVARAQFEEHAFGIEWAVSLSLLGVTAKTPHDLRFCVHWIRPYSGENPTWPPGLDFVGSARPGEPPPDLLRATGWGLLTGWEDASGPGAFSRTQWTEWIEHDREITRRGGEAHATVRLLSEEWKKTKKRDSELESQVFDNLAWIAQHEPLTPGDLLATAKVCRYLNRCERALGILDTLVNHPEQAVARSARFERAITREADSRFSDAAADWAYLERAIPPYASRYRQRAEAQRAQAEAWAAEQAARAEDDARGDLPLVALETNRGTIVIQLFRGDVPNAVEHFLALVEKKFYDGTLFHRVHGDFMAQVGDPASRDQGCEFAGSGTSPNEIEVEVNERHGFWRGAVGFALGRRRLNGSQFFIMTSPRPDLLHVMSHTEQDPFTCFGRVVAGMEAVDRIELCDPVKRAFVLRR